MSSHNRGRHLHLRRERTTINHAIYRALLEETDSGSGVFEGTVEYQMLNQRTVNDAKHAQ